MFARVAAAAIAIVAVSMPAWAAGQTKLQIFREVQEEVLEYPHFTIFDSVHAQIDNGVVTLTGKVTMPYKRDEIAGRVAEVNGVREVRNRIDVLPVSQFDDELRFRIARAIYGNSNFWTYAAMVNPPIHIIVERGRVTLEGVVNSEVDRMLAHSIAGSFNAFSVTNNLRTNEEARGELERL
ncbi:MAG: BON domain-containing protein [Acidobacteria bacterium]|nr:BON domain-containing protein [Acidobacteriota bacterium]